MIDCLVSTGTNVFMQSLRPLIITLDKKLKDRSPTTLILTTATTLFALSFFAKYFQKEWDKTTRDQIGALALRLPYVKRKYTEDINKHLVHFQESTAEKWKKFGEIFTTLPEKGWTKLELLGLIDRYNEITAEGLKDKHLSGTIYAKSLDQDYEPIQLYEKEKKLEAVNQMNDIEYFDFLSQKLKRVFTAAFEKSYLWNSLHSDEFGIGAFIDYQVVRIVADMFGGLPNEVMGFVTSGGTESIMLAMRAYREWGIANRGHQPGEGIIIASESVHAAVLKAGKAYLINVQLIKTNEAGQIDINQLKKIVEKYGDKVIAIVGSAPSYPIGVIDPIEEMAAIAKENGCGMHVDCCLGAFIVNNLEKNRTDYLRMLGVTTLSADTHKGGLSPKGSSVLVTKPLGEQNLAYYSIYSIPEWSGGVYGTPNDPGSRSCEKSINALLALMGTGKEGYQRIAQAIHKTTLALAKLIVGFDGQLKLIADPEANVVAFQIDKKWGLEQGATYAFAHEMAKRKFILNTLSHDRVHFCVTIRFAGNPKLLNQFKVAVKESLIAIKNSNDRLVKEGKKFAGDAGMYCALEAAMEPDSKTLSTLKYMENLVLGRKGARDAVRAYFLAQLNPFQRSV